MITKLHCPTLRGVDTHDAPASLKVASALVLVQAVVLGGYGVAVLLHLTQKHLTVNLSSGGFFLIAAVGLGWSAWSVRRAHSWARGPVLIAQLISLGLAWNFKDGGTWPASVGLAVPAVAVLVAMLRPESLAALDGSAED